LQSAAFDVKEALQMRIRYCDRAGHYFPITTRRFLSGEYPAHLPAPRQKVQSGQCSHMDRHIFFGQDLKIKGLGTTFCVSAADELQKSSRDPLLWGGSIDEDDEESKKAAAKHPTKNGRFTPSPPINSVTDTGTRTKPGKHTNRLSVLACVCVQQHEP
jgi:hypothetical protein